MAATIELRLVLGIVNEPRGKYALLHGAIVYTSLEATYQKRIGLAGLVAFQIDSRLTAKENFPSKNRSRKPEDYGIKL